MSSLKRSHFLKNVLPALLWAVTIFVASSIPKVTLPKLQFIAVDKLVHTVVFFVLGILVYRAFEPLLNDGTIRFKRFLISSLLTMSYGIMDEVHQAFVPGRHLDKYDMMADGLGALAAVVVMYAIEKIRQRKRRHA